MFFSLILRRRDVTYRLIRTKFKSLWDLSRGCTDHVWFLAILCVYVCIHSVVRDYKGNINITWFVEGGSKYGLVWVYTEVYIWKHSALKTLHFFTLSTLLFPHSTKTALQRITVEFQKRQQSGLGRSDNLLPIYSWYYQFPLYFKAALNLSVWAVLCIIIGHLYTLSG